MEDKKSCVWVTGASSGIGKAISLEFLTNGKRVVGSARRIEALNKVKDGNDSAKESFIPVVADFSNRESITNAYNKIASEYTIDCLINNAGTTVFKPALDTSFDELEDIVKTNLIGSMISTQLAIEGMVKKGSGCIINILSVAAEKIFTNSSAYAASKAGLRAYMNVLREELREHNIKVINVLPGATKTPIWPSKALEKYSNRMMSPTDIAKIIYELYSIDSSLVPEEIVIRPPKGDL